MEQKRTDYESVIRKLSSAYDKKGRVGHDNMLYSLEKEMEKSSYGVVRRVVLEEYVENRSPSNRIFGSFPEGDIKNLVVKCNELERVNRSSLQ